MMRRIRFFSSSSRLSKSEAGSEDVRRAKGLEGGSESYKGLEGPLTFVHPVQDCFQHVLAVAVAVLLPHGAVLAAQHHQLTVAVAQRGEVRDFHDDRPANQQSLQCGGRHPIIMYYTEGKFTLFTRFYTF